MKQDTNDEKPLIKVNKNGPLVVKRLNTFKNSKGKDLPIKPTMVLCRCGNSTRKPLCDGSHGDINFSGEKQEDRQPEKVDVYKGKDIVIYDNRGICSHRGYCSEGLPAVFRSETEPWIDPDGAPAEDLIAICEKCPSGALSYGMPNGSRLQEVEGRGPAIRIAPRRYDADGPYDITGGIEMADPGGLQPESQEHYTLCRCGSSKNKPFCDGNHWHVNFIDDDN